MFLLQLHQISSNKPNALQSRLNFKQLFSYYEKKVFFKPDRFLTLQRSNYIFIPVDYSFSLVERRIELGC